MLDSGTRLGRYELLGLLGAGGMGEVYRARDTALGRDVAIKMPPLDAAFARGGLTRFEREARAAAALQHPNILDVHDVGEIDGHPFVVTELLVGETLRERLARGGAVPWERAVEVASAVADGLSAAHAAGLVHRDVKPDNLFLTADGRVKILDFGLVHAEPGAARASPKAATLTEENVVIGTPPYLAPERLRGAPADARSDLFALGCVLYEMLTGERAFRGASSAETWSAILKEEPLDLRLAAPGVPDAVRSVVLRCLEKEPGARFQSARDLAYALRAAASAPKERTPPSLRAVAIAVAVVALASGLVATLARPRAPGRRDSVAVLPFACAEKGAEYLGDGLAESVINRLSRLGHVRVAARTSAFALRSQPDARTAGRTLGVAAVVTGRAAREGERLVVQVDLVDVATGAQLWGERYARPFADAAAVEDDVAREVAEALGARLTGDEKAALQRTRASDPEAYDLYLRARFLANRRDEEGLTRALELYDEALREDPKDPLIWSGIADAYDLVAFYGAASPKDVLPKAREAARKALALDERTPEAHASLADILYQYDFDWPGAEREFQRALALAPNAATAHHWYSNYLSASSRFKESFAEIEKARALDPMNPLIESDVALASYWAGKLDEAAARLAELARTEPSFPLAHLYLALARAHQGRFADADAALDGLEHASGGPGPDSIALRGWVAAKAGRTADARARLADLRELAKTRFVSAFPIAFVEVGLGEKSAAIADLERAFEEKAGRLVYLNVERAFDPLRAEPRFRDLVKKIGIPAR